MRLFVAQKVVPVLPAAEKWRLCDQLIRAARSATANIAEGDGRFNYLDNAKFCRNARGSCKEVLDHLITGVDEKLMPDEMLEHGRLHVERGVKLLSAYIRYLNQAHRDDA